MMYEYFSGQHHSTVRIGRLELNQVPYVLQMRHRTDDVLNCGMDHGSVGRPEAGSGECATARILPDEKWDRVDTLGNFPRPNAHVSETT